MGWLQMLARTLGSSSMPSSRYMCSPYLVANGVCSLSNSLKSTHPLAMYDMLPPLGSSWRVVKDRQTASIMVTAVASAAIISHDVDQGFRNRDRFLEL